tara:strand:+ start:137 stop:1270 length:1134 start_codon:yes stop_codon:yes gene_type:complete
MTVNVSKPAFNIREKLSELDKPTGIKGTELMRSETSQEARDLIGSGRKNMIINGAMNFHQRGGTSTGEGYVLDRWHIWSNPTGKHTVSQDTETPVGFKYSMKWTSTSAYTPTSGKYFYTGQKIEGHNWDKLEYGTANAKTITISFWARSSITGTWSGIVKNNAQNRTYPWEYNINSANTWEYKTVTVPGCTDGTWLSGVNAGAWIYFCVGSTTSGTTYLGSANSWQNSNLIGTTGSNSLVNTNGATLYITGVQVEEGSIATEFEHRSYGEELELCQRYYMKRNLYGCCSTGFSQSGGGYNSHLMNIPLPVKMRTTPTVTFDNATQSQAFQPGGDTANFQSFANGPDFVSVTTGSTNSTWTTQVVSSSSPNINLSAEL